jgi:hypothetical protein
MAFDNHEYRRKHLKDSILHLEDKEEKLKEELRRLPKPSSNRMLAESLGTSQKGYHFQQMLLVLIQDEELIHWMSITEHSQDLVELTDKVMRERNIYKVGDAFYGKREHYRWRKYEFMDEVNSELPRQDEYIPTFYINDRYYYIEEDDYASEAIGEDIHYNFDVSGKPNGIYQVLVEYCQYGGGVDYWGEYDEGEIEVEYKIYESVPLYEFLANKDDMLAEANPEAEELADKYIYIQQTKHRGRRQMVDIDIEMKRRKIS